MSKIEEDGLPTHEPVDLPDLVHVLGQTGAVLHQQAQLLHLNSHHNDFRLARAKELPPPPSPPTLCPLLPVM